MAPELFNLRMYLRDDNQFLLVDELAGHNIEELIDIAAERKVQNTHYVPIILKFKRHDAIIL